ncbi:MAG: protein kinase [Bryobacteraceae bacterium]
MRQALSHYEIVEKLGEGGMGAVYKARDPRLNRFVALKVLHPDRASDLERRRRFIQEAQAASALNHPNILTIYDIGSADGVDFIVMEYIQGRTLDQALPRKGWNEILSAGIQIADALAAAHAAGIVHRDLKPGNIMVSDTGAVKVLDFGLAKLLEPLSAESAETRTFAAGTRPHTEEGAILGTVAYMSPEQAEGGRVDARSDIFAFGSVLYEMVTGQRAFRGETRLSTLSSILRDEPKPASAIVPAVPRELERIIARCLRKDPERRFQHMSDLKVALMDLKEESESGSLAAGPAGPPRKHVYSWMIGGAAVLALLLGAAAWWLLRGRGGTAELSIERLTYDKGATLGPTISDDGKLVAYFSDRGEEGNQDIWVQQIAGGGALRLTRHPAVDMNPSFSPDGSRIVFQSSRDGGGIYIVSTLGGEERCIAPGGVDPQFSPDGSTVAYVQTVPSGRTLLNRMFLVSPEGGPPRAFQPGFGVATMFGRSLSWSPDGKRILFPGLKTNDPGSFEWWVAPLDGGEPVATHALKNLPSTPLLAPLAWAGDYVYFSGGTTTEGTNLFRAPIRHGSWQITGPPERLTSGPGMQYSASISRDGRIVFPNLTWLVNIQSLAIDRKTHTAAGPPQPVTTDATVKFAPTAPAGAGKLAFVAFTGIKAGRRRELRIRDLASGAESAAGTFEPNSRTAVRFSRDGSMLGYTVEARPGKAATFAARTTGLSARQLCDRCSILGFFSNTAQLAVLRTPNHVLRLDAGAGAESALLADAEGAVLDADLSPDDRWMALLIEKPDGSCGLRIAPVRTAPAPVAEWIPVLDPPVWIGPVRWSISGDGLYFLAELDGYSCIWYAPLDPATKRPAGAPVAFYHAHTSRLSHAGPRGAREFTVAADRIFVNFAETSSNIWMAKLGRK